MGARRDREVSDIAGGGVSDIRADGRQKLDAIRPMTFGQAARISGITPADQAEAYFLLVSKRLSKTTGQVITVDGGLHEAFLR